MSKPLSGIRVLDLSRVLAGPFCTMTLLDLGAEVIKIEVPGAGDDSRSFGPFLEGKSLYFSGINRGKQSLAIDLKTERGREILISLVKTVDVLVENFRPGTMEKLGLGYEVLKDVNPRLIYTAISGFGHTGPDSRRPAYDILVQAMSGIMSITGWPDSPPTRVGMSTGDITAALYATIGISTALFQRERTGEGQKIDISMLDCQVAILENALSRFQVEGVAPTPLGNRHPTISPFQAFRASDGYFVVGAGNDSLWARLCEVVGHTHLATDPRFATNRGRTENVVEMDALLQPVFATKTVAEWLATLEAQGVPCAPVNTVAQVMQSRQLHARQMLVPLDDPDFPRISVPGNPIKMSTLPEEPSRPRAPDVGENGAQVLRDLLGLSDDEIAKLTQERVVALP